MALDLTSPSHSAPAEPRLSRSLFNHSVAGLLVITLAGGGLTLWAATTELSGAVMASGLLVVRDGAKLVQHPEGGVVSEILVRNEDHVEAGEVLVKLDGTATAAGLGVILSQLNDLLARQARLNAEIEGTSTIAEPGLLASWPDPQALRTLIEVQRDYMASRAEENRIQIERLGQQVEQSRRQIDGLVVQRDATRIQAEIVAADLPGLHTLVESDLLERSKLSAASREAARLAGEVGRLDAEIARMQTSIAEREMTKDSVLQAFRTSIMDDLQVVNASIAELSQRRVEAEDRLRRLEIRAPQTGIVQSSKVVTIGGVIAAGEVLMTIVPQQTELVADVRLSVTDIDKVHVGQGVTLRLTAFDSRTTPDFEGLVAAVTPDLETDPRTGAQFYSVRVRIDESERGQLPDGARLVPGMPAEAFINTGERSVLSYLVKPLADQISRAFRED